MENPQHWRDEKAKELKAIPDHEERREKLDEIKNTPEYEESIKETVSLVPVEKLIPDIKPKEEIPALQDVNYNTHRASDPFSRDFIEYVLRRHTRDRQIWPALRERFKNQVVVDLGAGENQSGYFLSTILGAKGYVGVEKFHHQQLSESIQVVDKEKIERMCKDFNLFSGHRAFYTDKEWATLQPSKKLIPASVEEDDMLRFLQRLPDSSVSILSFGIAIEIIPGRNYSDAVAKEIQRVLSPEGMYISDSSAIPTTGFKRLSRELEEHGKDPIMRAFLEKEGFFVKNIEQASPKHEDDEKIEIDKTRLQSIVESKEGFLAGLSNPPTMTDFDKTFKKGEKNAFDMVAYEYGGDECYDYNNFWTRLRDAWAMASADNFQKVNGEDLNTLETLAQRALGEKYPGPIKLETSMTMHDVRKHFHDICQTALEKPNEDREVSNILKILSDGWKNNNESELRKKKLYVDIDTICKENSLGDAENLYEQFTQLRDSDGLEGKEEATGLEILKSRLKAKMKIHQLLEIVYKKLLGKGYSAIELYG